MWWRIRGGGGGGSWGCEGVGEGRGNMCMCMGNMCMGTRGWAHLELGFKLFPGGGLARFHRLHDGGDLLGACRGESCLDRLLRLVVRLLLQLTPHPLESTIEVLLELWWRGVREE